MTTMKPLEILVGVKAEQTLRDTVRAAIEAGGDKAAGLELAPLGNKDWIAGVRLGPQAGLAEVKRLSREVQAALIATGSFQRIRIESVRAYAVQKPVPVFKETGEPAPADEPAAEGEEPIEASYLDLLPDIGD
jgi:hypothetical protein